MVRFSRAGDHDRRGEPRAPGGRRACSATSRQAGLVVPSRTAAGYRRYGIRELNQLRALGELRRGFGVELDELAFALRLRREPELRRAVETWLAGTSVPAADTRPRPGSNGSSASTSDCSQPGPPPEPALPDTERKEDRMATTQRHDVKDLALAPEGVRRIAVGRPADAGAGRDPGALRARAAARRSPRLGVPPRDDRDREPRPHAEGGWGGRRALRLEPALDAGRRRGRARRRVRHRGLRDQGRGQRHVLPPHRGRGRPPAAPDDGRRRRRDRRPPLAPPRAARRRHRRHRGDDDRRHPAEGARARGEARLPGHRGQRGADEAPVRQPLRHGAVDDRRDHPRDERPPRGRSASSSPATAGSGAASPCGHAAWART